MNKIALIVLFATAVFISGCYTRAYREAVQQSQQRGATPVVSQANK
jgi:hypothetical protein